MTEIHVFATVVAQAGKEAELQAVLEELVAATRQEARQPALYAPYQRQNAGDVLFF
jgi:quinol monooxygenase YgiN